MEDKMEPELRKLAMILFTVVMSIAAISYAVYMITALEGTDFQTPDEKTYRLAFFVVIIVVLAFLGLARDKINDNLLAVLGTIAGYVLGGVTGLPQDFPNREAGHGITREEAAPMNEAQLRIMDRPADQLVTREELLELTQILEAVGGVRREADNDPRERE